jgi:hypothetical protein
VCRPSKPWISQGDYRTTKVSGRETAYPETAYPEKWSYRKGERVQFPNYRLPGVEAGLGKSFGVDRGQLTAAFHPGRGVSRAHRASGMGPHRKSTKGLAMIGGVNACLDWPSGPYRGAHSDRSNDPGVRLGGKSSCHLHATTFRSPDHSDFSTNRVAGCPKRRPVVD